MKLLYISTFMFKKKGEATYGLPSCSDSFFEKYLDVFDSVRVLGEEIKDYLDSSNLVIIKDEFISVRILPRNTTPKEFKNDKILKNILLEEISYAEAILIKPSTRRGIMAIRIAESLNKPYMIEMTGDIHNALLQSSSLVRRLYAPIIYRNIKRAIAKCQFGLYVSEYYLQEKYKILGKTCGCSDVILDLSSSSVLEKRLEKIEQMNCNSIINLALIGFYKGNGKGIDTAIRALSKLPNNFQLTILGNGTEESRLKWYEYGKKYNVASGRIHFPNPLKSSDEVLLWLDYYDFFVLPTRSEGFGRCIVEAMSRGCPCFATKICTIPEFLSNDCLFQMDDDNSLAELLIKFTYNKDLMKKAAIENFESVKRFDFTILKERRNNFLLQFKNYCEEISAKSDDSISLN